MQREIWKYLLPIDEGPFELLMPTGAAVRCVQRQDGRAKLWAAVLPTSHQRPRQFYAVYTGQPLVFEREGRWGYIGTVVSDGTSIVVHYYERR